MGFPDSNNCIATKRYNADAYEFLLGIISGFKSKRFGETHIKNQFFDRWKKISTKPFFKNKKYETFIGNLRKDSNFIQNKIMSGLKATDVNLIARDLSKQSCGDQVVVIGDVNHRGIISSHTKRMIRISENKQKNKNKFLTFTHPDAKVLGILQTTLLSMKSRGELSSDICFSFFDQIGNIISQADRVYSCIPMGTNVQGERVLVSAWQNSAKVEATLTHLSGVPGTKSLSNEFWFHAELKNFTSPEAILLEMEHRSAINEQIVAGVKKSFALIAQIRAEGRQVHMSELEEKAPEIFELVLA